MYSITYPINYKSKGLQYITFIFFIILVLYMKRPAPIQDVKQRGWLLQRETKLAGWASTLISGIFVQENEA